MYRERVLHLISAIDRSDDEDLRNEDLTNVGIALESFGDYFSKHYTSKSQTPVLIAMYRKGELRKQVQALSWKRKASLGRIATNISLLNNLCRVYHTRSIYTEDVDEDSITEFCKKIVTEFYTHKGR